MPNLPKDHRAKQFAGFRNWLQEESGLPYDAVGFDIAGSRATLVWAAVMRMLEECEREAKRLKKTKPATP